MNQRLKLLSGNEPLVPSPTDGQETLAQATEVFMYIGRKFEEYFAGLWVRSPAKTG